MLLSVLSVARHMLMVRTLLSNERQAIAPDQSVHGQST